MLRRGICSPCAGSKTARLLFKPSPITITTALRGCTNASTTTDRVRSAIDEATKGTGYSCKSVSWEDAQRGTVNGTLSCLGGNISDVRLWERNGTLLYTCRSDNWNERVGYVSAKDVSVLVGNHRPPSGDQQQPPPVQSISLKEFLESPSEYAAYAGIDPEKVKSLFLPEKDSLLSIRFQTVFLPVASGAEAAEGGDAQEAATDFCTETYNYNTRSTDDPKNLLLLCTGMGTAVQQDGPQAQRLFHHDVQSDGSVNRYWLRASASRHKVGGEQKESAAEAAAALSKGQSASVRIGTSAMGTRFNTQMMIQLPLKVKPVERRSFFGGTQPSGPILGIKVGATNIEVAWPRENDDFGVFGQNGEFPAAVTLIPPPLPNADSNGGPPPPFFAGPEAKRNLTDGVKLEETVTGMLNLIGRKYDDPCVQAMIARLNGGVGGGSGQFAIVKGADDAPMIAIPRHGSTPFSTTSSSTNELWLVSPEYALSRVLLAATDKAKELMKADPGAGEVKGTSDALPAVLTCPPNFNDAQRQALKEAAELANITALRIINRPTASVYKRAGGSNSTADFNVLVVHVGGDSAEATWLEYSCGVYEVLSSRREEGGKSAGDAFDAALAALIAKRFDASHAVDVTQSPLHRGQLRRVAETIKRSFCQLLDEDGNGCLEVQVDLESIAPGLTPSPTLRTAAATPPSVTVTRADFEQLSEPIVSRIVDLCKAAIEEGSKAPNWESPSVAANRRLDKVSFVGGMSEAALIRDAVRKVLGEKVSVVNEEPAPSASSDASVAASAAYFGTMLRGNVHSLLLLDVEEGAMPISAAAEASSAEEKGVFGTLRSLFGGASSSSSSSTDGTSRAARIGRGALHDTQLKRSVVTKQDPVRDPDAHGTITVTTYNTVSGGVPSADDVKAAIDDLDRLYARCDAEKRLRDAGEITKPLTVEELDALLTKAIIDEPYQPSTN